MSPEQETIFNSIPKLDYTESSPKIDPKEFVKVVESRRSVRVYQKEAIPEAVTRECLRLAMLAPNSSNLQPWEFYWVRSPEAKSKLVEACFSQPAAKTAAELIVMVARTQTWEPHRQQMLQLFAESETPPPHAAVHYYEKLVPLAYRIGPFGIAGWVKRIVFWAIGHFRVVPREPTSASELTTWAVKSTALACENLMLAYRAFGYDTCPMEGFDSKRVKQILKLPRDSTIAMVISAGRRAENGIYGPRVRFNENQFVKIIQIL